MAYYIESNEVVVLLIILSGYFPIILSYFKNKSKLSLGSGSLFLAYTALLVGGIATVFEGFIYSEELHFIEHSVGLFLSSLIFLVCAYLSHKKIKYIQESVKSKLAGGRKK